MFVTTNDLVGCRLNFNRSLTAFLIIWILFTNCYDSAKIIEISSSSSSSTAAASLLNNHPAHRNSSSSSASQIRSTKQHQHQPKPSSVIYIPSLDDVNMASRLYSSEHDIRFEDFFWDGSGDGEPLILSLKSNARLTAMSGFVGRETFIKTATVIATVYIDDSNEHETDPNCKWPDCDDDTIGIPDIYLPPNKRFWLVTTVFGQLNDADIPLLQQQLADIYRIAFAKQQSLHLGISNVTVDASAIANDTTSIIENKQSTNLSMPISPTSVLKYEYDHSNSTTSSSSSSSSTISSPYNSLQPNLVIDNTTITTTFSMQPSKIGSVALHSISSLQSDMAVGVNEHRIDSHQTKRFASSIFLSPIMTTTNKTIATAVTANVIIPTTDKTNTASTTSTFRSSQIILQTTMNAMNNSKTNEPRKTYRSTTLKHSDNMHRSDDPMFVGHINILIHNISVINWSDKDDLDKSDREWMNTPSQTDDNGNFSSDSLATSDNQTEIIYTVFVNGMPVLAKIAANDMQLMSDAEVSNILDMAIHTKAEPYLKDPQATPLIPSSTVTTDQNKPILAMIFQNSYILAFILSLLVLIILLLMLLMLVAGTKNQQNNSQKGLTTTAAQTARQPPNLPAVPSKRKHSSGHTNESHQYRANIENELVTHQSENGVHADPQQQQQQQQQYENEHHHNNQKKKQVGTQITSLHEPIDGYAYNERDHSFIIIPTPLKHRHNKKYGTPTIYFPEPPASEPSQPPSPSQSHHSFGTYNNSGSGGSGGSSSNSTSMTSDTESSIYYIKTHKSRRHHLYTKRPKHITAVNQREYATITKKQIERAQQKKSKHKHRKYLTGVGNGNRVGAFEVQVHSSRSSSMATAAAAAAATAAKATFGQNIANEETYRLRSSVDNNFEMSTGKDSNLYEHIEAFNPMVGKKNIHNQFMSTKRQQQQEHHHHHHHHHQMDIDKKSLSSIANEHEKHMQSKSHMIDRRQNENDNVNHLGNGMNTLAASDTAQQQPKLKLKKPNSSNEVFAISTAAAATVRPSSVTFDTKYSSNLSDDSIKMKTERIPKQMSTDDDVGSVGSFLSMASVRSFPKCSVPEPLNRVLEKQPHEVRRRIDPVSITYLDQYDEIEATEAATMASKLPRIVDAKAKKSSTSKSPPQPQPASPPPPPPPPLRSCTQHEHSGTKQNSDEIVYLSRTRSDCADPGVIGPIAWQYHKKRLEDQQNTKHHIDPKCTQHRYEDLVEGAISLYSIETTEYHTIETITKEEFPEVLIGKDMRGKSADIFPNSVSTQSPQSYRPFTAIPSKAPASVSEEPQITSKDAWAGSTLIHQSTYIDAIAAQSDEETIESEASNSKLTEKHQ